MRMTNEEFQAEVFRRSQVYLEERRRSRRQFFTRAAAFAGCFVLLAGALTIRMATRRSSDALYAADNNAGNFTLGDSCSPAEYSEDVCAEQACEAEAEAENSCADEAPAKRDDKYDTQSFQSAIKTPQKTSDSSTSLHFSGGAENSGIEPAANADAKSESAEKELSAEDYFDTLGINPMPEMLGGYKFHGNPTATRALRTRNAFSYIDETGSEALTVYLQPENDPDMNEKAVLLHAANDGYTAEFVLHNAHVTLESRSAALTDSESLSALAEELMAVLEKQ